MARSVLDDEVSQVINAARAAARARATKAVTVGGEQRAVPYPFPSPVDWRERWIYFLLLDRFNNPTAPPAGPWNQRFDFRHGGTLAGVTAQLDYLAELGAPALWLSPVLKNPRPDFRWNYHGYAAQDFLAVDERFGSDGTRGTAERELVELVEQAHARGMVVVLDIVLNHAGRVFDYVRDGHTVQAFSDPAVMNAPLGGEAAIRWLNGFGQPRADWQDVIPPGQLLSPDDAVYPDELRRHTFFRRRGSKLTDDPGPEGYVRGDFDDLRQLVFEYDASAASDTDLRQKFGRTPVLDILVRIYGYLIARYDFDGLRIDTAKYVSASHLERFGNAMREFGHSIGKHNLFTFGEVYDDEETIARFIGRNGSEVDSFGIDAALDFPLFFVLPAVAKGERQVQDVAQIFTHRKSVERELLSSHGEAGRFFVSFLDNHDQRARFALPGMPPEQVTLGLALLFCLQGIPALYYGTEQGLRGTVDGSGDPDLTWNESTREALWGAPAAFDRSAALFQVVQSLARVRAAEPSLQYGRLYFREVSGNGHDFGPSLGAGGCVAFSRILYDREVTVIANTSTSSRFDGIVLQDAVLNATPRAMSIAFSNRASTGSAPIRLIPDARFYTGDQLTGSGPAAGVAVSLAPMEVQVLVPG